MELSHYIVIMHLLAITYLLKSLILQLTLAILTFLFIVITLAKLLLVSNMKINKAIKHITTKSGKFKAPGSLPLRQLVSIHMNKDTKYKEMLAKSKFLKCNSFIQYNNQRILEKESMANLDIKAVTTRRGGFKQKHV